MSKISASAGLAASCALGSLLSSGMGFAGPLPKALETCISLQRDAERLACYDQAVAALQKGDDAAPSVTAENMFGASTAIAPSDPQRREVKREELRQISGTVTSLRKIDDGMIVIELDNGQIWRQQDVNVRLMVSPGDQVTIVRASLGTFRIADKTGRFARFKRVR